MLILTLSGGKLKGLVSRTTRFALSLPLLRSGPLPFTSPRAAMVSDTYIPKSSAHLEASRQMGSFFLIKLEEIVYTLTEIG